MWSFCAGQQVVVQEKKRKKEKFEVEADEFQPSVKMEPETQADRPVRACRTQQGSVLTYSLFLKLNPHCMHIKYLDLMLFKQEIYLHGFKMSLFITIGLNMCL